QLPDVRLPAAALTRTAHSEREARKELLDLAAQHHGIATFTDLTDYHRQMNKPARPLVDELVVEGRLVPVVVPGWGQQAYLHVAARIPRRVSARALLSPFDPVVWNRQRAERLFGFRYRIEIYTPQAKRIYGYYVLPFLLGDRLVGRVDLKADRATGRLLVQGVYSEAASTEVVADATIAGELAAELREMAAWLELAEIVVEPRGNLAGPLTHALAAAA
ncbi:MAG: crosslink repair DNA glycosylase YcaQ family protein, partial [Ilumatobacteraceae bacterium]